MTQNTVTTWFMGGNWPTASVTAARKVQKAGMYVRRKRLMITF